MKRVVMVLISVLCLTACNEKDNSQIDSTVEEVVAETTDYIIATEKSMTTTDCIIATEKSTTETSPYVIYKEILPPVNLELSENGLNVVNFNTGKTVQTIEGDFKSQIEIITADADFYRRPEEYITREDYDFDGYNDLFIPTELKESARYGVYYHYNPDTELYEEWDTLNKLGYQLYSYMDNKLSISLVDDTYYKYYQYIWNDDELEIVTKNERFEDEQKNFHQIIFSKNDDGKIIDREYYFDRESSRLRITDDNIYCGEQYFDVEFSNLDIIISDYISFQDYDFDGYDDLLIYEALGESSEDNFCAKYYRYNSEKQFFDEWDILNDFGKYLYVHNDDKMLSTDKYDMEKNSREIVYYVFEDEKLKPISATVSFKDENYDTYQNIYEYDENGERVLTGTELIYEYIEPDTLGYEIITDDLGQEYTVPLN